MPLPGSAVWDMAQEKDLLEIVSPGWDNFGRYGEPIIRLKDVSQEELSRYFVKAYRDFYIRPAYVLQRLRRIRSKQDVLNLFKNGIALLKFLSK